MNAERASSHFLAFPIRGGEERREPCGACKFLRRRCAAGCVFAPHFGGGEQQQQSGGASSSAARFAAVHKVFGASNVAKLLTGQVPPARHRDAMLTICYEAQARLADPVYGCVSTILALQHQVTLLQAELSIIQSQLLNSKLALATAHQSSQNFTALQPAYSNNSSMSNNLMNPSRLPISALDIVDNEPSSRVLELAKPLQDEDDEEESQNLAGFNNCESK
ncbi:LOB domain-containing protein 20 [Ananas comosus]|uniref:LOB domain-containing protein 20 n=1 Tax=Ananas comosus TaxID=4615 RepID=A0A6P5ERN2_ANACO|nr:LOB domain-containing protein 20 [Ananas comosus]